MLRERVRKLDIQSPSLQAYIHSPEKQATTYKRTLMVIVLSQILGGAGLAAGFWGEQDLQQE